MKPLDNIPFSDNPNNFNDFLRCFFCLNLGDWKGSEVNSSFNKLSIRNISRYLQLCPPRGDGKESWLCDLINGKQEMCSSSSCGWFICESCSQMAVEFNDLYQLMEVTRMRLNWCLEKMQDVIEKGGSTPEDKNKDGHRENLRETVRAAINGRVEKVTPTPRVALCKSQAVEDRLRLLNYRHSSEPEPEDFCGNHDDFDDDADSPLQSPEIVSFEDVKIKTEGESPFPTPSTSLNWKSIHSRKEKVKRIKICVQNKKSKVPIKCSFCRAQFQQSYARGSPKGRGEMLLHWHVIQNHCDQLFPNQRLNTVTDSQFKKILMELLFKDLIKDKGDTICAFCNRKFKCFKVGDTKRVKYIAPIKGHYIQDHFEEVEEKLREIQRDPNLEKILSKCNPSGKICKCGVYLQNIPARIQHKMWHCPLTATATEVKQQNETPSFPRRTVAEEECEGYTKSPETEPSPYLACNYCSFECDNRPNAYCAARNNMRMHLLRLHPGHYFHMDREGNSKWKDENFEQILRKVLFPKFIIIDGIFTSCPLCEVKYKGVLLKNNIRNSQMHLVNHHMAELSQSLKVILEEDDEVLEEKLGGGCSKKKNKAEKFVESELD